MEDGREQSIDTTRGVHIHFVLKYTKPTKINVTSFSTRGKGESLSAQILADSEFRQYHLLYTWVSTANGPIEGEEYAPGMFYGTTKLELINGKEKNWLASTSQTGHPNKPVETSI